MKKKFYLLALPALMLSMVACSDDDDNVNPNDVPTVCTQAFSQRYPEVKNPKWEQEGTYYTAEWKEASNLRSKEAWFKQTAEVGDSWVMTETDYGKDIFMVPTELNDSFNKTEYSNATIDEIELYEYADNSRDAYIIEVTPQASTSDLLLVFRASDYSFVKAMPDTGVDITPDTQIL